ncbi:hypothetical protein BMS56_23885 [Salmonella enterica]|nr:hypothetical protein [Salmonella enterica subsp. enterica serovar Liverpool]EAA7283821.1 hypothetical protein [Salmonella enterica]EAW1937062.1 hypothetical protein [Salmonella enterica subsp. enterica]EAA8532336.1 hypothetical protein [Salmonella enterica]EAA8747627.1 hypothetical protein [Salmonella enterica]
MAGRKIIRIGVAIILISCFLLWVSSLFHSYMYSRLGLNRNSILTFLWELNFISSFLLYYFFIKNRLMISIGYILLLSGFTTFSHFLSGKIGFVVDFSGASGLKVVCVIYFVISSIIIGVGGFLGFITSAFRKIK